MFFPYIYWFVLCFSTFIFMFRFPILIFFSQVPSLFFTYFTYLYRLPIIIYYRESMPGRLAFRKYCFLFYLVFLAYFLLYYVDLSLVHYNIVLSC